MGMTQTDFLSLLPENPYCVDVIGQRLLIRPRIQAVEHLLIQPNAPMQRQWLVFDLDHDDSYFIPDERGCPDPHFISVNRLNGHAHVGYLLDQAVTKHEKSRRAPIELYEDVERGLSRRMGADPAYKGLLCKNPTHPHWETHWQAQRAYDLVRLADCLDKKDKKKSPGVVIGFGRNCSIFDRLRKIAYSEVLAFKKEGRSEESFRQVMEGDALRINGRFAMPLMNAEARGIARSVSKWVWQRFSLKKFSEIQSKRVSKRWEGKETLVKTMPWEAEGISRRTWYRRQTPQSYYPDMVSCHLKITEGIKP